VARPVWAWCSGTARHSRSPRPFRARRSSHSNMDRTAWRGLSGTAKPGRGMPGETEGDRHHLCFAPFGPLRGKWSQSPAKGQSPAENLCWRNGGGQAPFVLRTLRAAARQMEPVPSQGPVAGRDSLSHPKASNGLRTRGGRPYSRVFVYVSDDGRGGSRSADGRKSRPNHRPPAAVGRIGGSLGDSASDLDRHELPPIALQHLLGRGQLHVHAG
jgi:hypothetical protein